MLKPMILASAMMLSTPVLAQAAADTQTTSQATGSTSQQDRTPADDGARSDYASAAQVAKIVEAEFPSYDSDKDGQITQDEFSKWMVALRRATDPETDVQSAEVQTWVGQAFASADADKSLLVSKVELTAFLSKGA